MPQDMTKEKVFKHITKERRTLENTLAKVTEEEIIQPGKIKKISIKDYLTYLIGWEKLLMGWIDIVLMGQKPEFPAPGMTWSFKDIHILDHQFIIAFQEHSLKDTLEEFQASHQAVLVKL